MLRDPAKPGLAAGLCFAATLAIAVSHAPTARADDATPFERGVARVRADDFIGAIPPLVQAHAADPSDTDTALLLGIAYYRTGRLDDARPLLHQAEQASDAETQASARVFLGLIADARGNVSRARGYYALVARSSTDLGASGRLLLDDSGAERWSVVAILRPGYDSDVPLLPATATPPGAGMSADADLTMIARATARPSLALPLVLDDTLSYRKQAQLAAYDMLADSLGATLTLAGTADRASLAYHFEAEMLGGARYELGHVVELAYRHQLGGELGIGARYTLAARDYAQDAYSGYSGLEHVGVAELAWGEPTTPTEVTLGYVIDRDGTDDPALAELGQGGQLTLRARPWSGGELQGAVLAENRMYDAASMGRQDVLVTGSLALYVDLSQTFGLVFGASATRNASNVAVYDYTKWTGYAGLIVGASS